MESLKDRIAREFGTPCYVVAEDDIRARARAFVEAFRARTDDFEVVFASKAFPCTAVYRLLWEEGIGSDVAGGRAGDRPADGSPYVCPAEAYAFGRARSR